MPGLERTSASASAPRVPVPFGRPRRPLPLLLARFGRGLRAGATCDGRGRRGGAAVGRRDAVERRGCGLEALILVDERLEFFQPRANLASLLVKEVCHVRFPVQA